MFTLNITEVHAVCYTKKRRASSKDDYETWEESETANTLNQFDGGGSTRAVDVVVYEREDNLHD